MALLRLRALVVCSLSFLLAVVWSTVNREWADDHVMALRASARMKKGHRPFRECWKRGQRRARDALPAIRQSQLNLAWNRARSQKKKPPTKHSKDTLKILEDVLKDPVLSEELAHYAGYKIPQEVPEDTFLAVQRSIGQLLGEDSLQSITASPTTFREGPQLAVCLDRSLSQYDRNDLAVALQALGFEARVTRHGVKLSDKGPEVEVLMGRAEELVGHKGGGFCPFPVAHLTVAEDWREADRRGQEEVDSCEEIRWALDLTQHLATTAASGLPSLALRGKSQKGAIVFELVLRHLALRIQDRDAQSLRRFKAALASQDDEVGHVFGSHLAVSMAKEILEWSKSGVLGLWLKDAELYAGKRGKTQASHLLNAAAQQLDGEVWGLGHTQSCPLPKEESLEATADRLLTKGIRLVHFGCYEDAAERLSEAEALLTHAERYAQVHERLSLAATLTKFLLEKRRGRPDKARRLNGECEEAIERFEHTSASARPLACWHNLPLLLRATSKPALSSSRGAQSDSDSLWPNFQATGADDLEVFTGEALNCQEMRRSSNLIRRLMPMTGRRFAKDELELCRVQKGFAKILGRNRGEM